MSNFTCFDDFIHVPASWLCLRCRRITSFVCWRLQRQKKGIIVLILLQLKNMSCDPPLPAGAAQINSYLLQCSDKHSATSYVVFLIAYKIRSITGWSAGILQAFFPPVLHVQVCLPQFCSVSRFPFLPIGRFLGYMAACAYTISRYIRGHNYVGTFCHWWTVE